MICSYFQLNLKTYTLPLGGLTESALLSGDIDAKQHPQNSSLLGYFVPGRNAILLAMAASRAYTLGATKVYSGICSTSPTAYPDCKYGFVQSMTNTMRLALDFDSLEFLNPAMNLERWQIFQAAYDMDRATYPNEIHRNPLLCSMIFDTHTGYVNTREVQYSWGMGSKSNLDNAQLARQDAYFKFLQESGHDDQINRWHKE